MGEADADELRALVEEHHRRTGSAVAARLLAGWEDAVRRFVKVMPHDYKRALEDGVVEPKGDNPTSTGSGFLTESEEAA